MDLPHSEFLSRAEVRRIFQFHLCGTDVTQVIHIGKLKGEKLNDYA